MRVEQKRFRYEAEQFTGTNGDFIVGWLEAWGETGHYDDGLEYIIPGHPIFAIPVPLIKIGERCGGEEAEVGDWIIINLDRNDDDPDRVLTLTHEHFALDFEVPE